MKKLLLVFFFFCISISLYCQMNINDPQDWWGESPASIENVEIEVRTLGAYSETAIAFDIYMGDSYYFEGVDLLEFTFDFKLDEGAVVNDSWLWINDYISKGDVYEQGEGTQIYESIVDRQQDPSILTQNSSTEYNLKVYPLKWDSTRRVRISYLEPLQYHGKKADINLPLELLNHSEWSPENIRITIFEDDIYANNGIDSEKWGLVEEGVDFKVYKNNYVFDQGQFLDTPVSFSFVDQESDHFLSTYEGEDDNFYQLVYYPEVDVENSIENRMIIFDFDPFTSDESFEIMKQKLRSALTSMTDEDYFIICNSDFITKFSSENWLLATEENIENALANINLTSGNIESRLSTLLPEAMNKVDELGQDAEIILLSPNNEYTTEVKAKAFLNGIIEFYEEMDSEVSISVVDYANSKSGNTIDGVYYQGNDYIYQNLTQETNGNYFTQLSGDDVSSSLSSLFASSVAFTDQYEFYLSVEDGFVYSDFDNLKNKIEVGSDKPIVSTGKYIGEGMFDVRFNAKIGNDIYTDVQKLSTNDNNGLDEKAQTIWYSELIKSLQHSGEYEDKRNVIQTSIDERLLSLHTVFLCLEPDFESISENNNNEDDTSIVSVSEVEPNPEVKLNVYPNPFVERLTIEFPFDLESFKKEVVINILDSRGQLVERIIKSNGLIDGMNAIEWIPTMKLTDGIYVIQVLINDTMYNQKVLHVRS